MSETAPYLFNYSGDSSAWPSDKSSTKIKHEYGAMVKRRGQGKTEVLGEKLSQCYLVHQKSHMYWVGIEPGPPW
jgi:hypothetical protein